MTNALVSSILILAQVALFVGCIWCLMRYCFKDRFGDS